MLVVLGFAMIATFMYLIMSKRTTPVAALILVPLVFGLLAGGGLGLAGDITDSISAVAPTAALRFFAIIFFGTMIDVGLFDPLIRWLLRIVGNDPVKIVMGTALLTTLVSLDGDGSTNSTLSTVPWGGSTARAAAALHVSPIDIFVPMIPAVAASLVAVFILAYWLGRGERKRLGLVYLRDGVLEERLPVGAASGWRDITAAHGETTTAASSAHTGAHAGTTGQETSDFVSLIKSDGIIDRPSARPKLVWVNLFLTLTVMTLLVEGAIEPAVIFLGAVGIALVLNFPRVADQADQIKAHADSVIGVVGMVFAATVLTGVLNGSGMVEAMAAWLVDLIPASLGGHLPFLTGILSIPMTFFTSNDAFYFGVLPVLNETASAYGVSPLEMARASLVGQPLHQSSPIVASFLLLVGLAKVELADHHQKAIWRAVLVGLVMLIVGGLTGAYPL